MSKPETKIANLLFNAGIKYEREKTFSDLRGGRYRFDFYIPSMNCIIEYQGEQHYKQVFGTKQDMLAGQERDRRKISYCLANGIRIYCIPFWEQDKLSTVYSLFNPQYIALNRWKNDFDWTNYLKENGKKITY